MVEITFKEIKKHNTATKSYIVSDHIAKQLEECMIQLNAQEANHGIASYNETIWNNEVRF